MNEKNIEAEIAGFCRQLSEYWKMKPNMRFAQWMSNILGQYMHDTGRDPFFVNNKEFMAYIRWYSNGGASPYNYGPRPGDIERGNDG